MIPAGRAGRGRAEEERGMSERKIVEYAVATNGSYLEFVNEVNAYLEKGWELWGSMTVMENGQVFAQAMVRWEQPQMGLGRH
jgi:hypothetical protein